MEGWRLADAGHDGFRKTPSPSDTADLAVVLMGAEIILLVSMAIGIGFVVSVVVRMAMLSAACCAAIRASMAFVPDELLRDTLGDGSVLAFGDVPFDDTGFR